MLSRSADTPELTIEQQVMGLARAGRCDQALQRIMPLFKRREVFVKVWKALPRFDERATLSTWIYAITRNTSLSALRGRRETCELEGALASQDNQGEEQVERMLLQRLIDRLPDMQRQVITLFYMQDHSHETVSQMLDIPLGTVKTLLHRARERLRVEAAHD
jgi:RNA polymerase sigma-70 factor (ECF subfamily)